MTKYLLTSIIISFFCQINAQNIDFKNANFKEDREGLKAAIKAIKVGDDFFEIANEAMFLVKSPGLNYEWALQEYQKAQNFNKDNALNNFKIGVCYINSTYQNKGISYIYKAQKLDPSCDPFMQYYYGIALQLDAKFSDALKAFTAFENNYKKADNFKKFVSMRKKECKAARGAIQNPIRAWVDNVAELNSPQNDYAPSISTDGGEVIFTSDRPNEHDANSLGGYDKDIYSSTLNKRKWAAPKQLKGGVNTTSDEVSNNISYDGTKLLFHREDEGQFDVFESTLVGADWTNPKKLPFQISSKRANEVYAAYSPDGWSIYFNRDNANRSNGFEVMYSSMQSKMKKNYMAAQMITSVNSKFNEGPIYITLDGSTMYIASEGGDSYGGYEMKIAGIVGLNP